jgi:hypothetical protein
MRCDATHVVELDQGPRGGGEDTQLVPHVVFHFVAEAVEGVPMQGASKRSHHSES